MKFDLKTRNKLGTVLSSETYGGIGRVWFEAVKDHGRKTSTLVVAMYSAIRSELDRLHSLCLEYDRAVIQNDSRYLIRKCIMLFRGVASQSKDVPLVNLSK